MQGTRTVLASGFLTVFLIAASFARSAADECLTKPNGPTPQGQHWYYRLDHANNGRQCWYLRAEIARAQKTSRQTERNSSDAMAQAIQAPPASAAEMPPEGHAAVAATPIPWLNVHQLPEPVVAPKYAPPTPGGRDTTSAAADNPTREQVADPPAAAPSRPASSADSNPAPQRAREPQRRQQVQARPEPPAPAIAQIDHTFAVLMILFTALAIAGPALHFMDRRRRRREAVDFRPPPWARVVALNAPTPRIRVMARPQIARPVAPVPVRPPDQTERLAHALQQLVDRLQTTERPQPKAVRISPRGRASM